jgi:hypothetical protein
MRILKQDPYHVVLVPKTKTKKQKANERGINYPGE